MQSTWVSYKLKNLTFSISFSMKTKLLLYFLVNLLMVFHTGGYDKEEKAARAYDLAALKYWGATTTTNFPVGHVSI